MTEGRESAEASFIFCLYKQPELFDDFKNLNENNDETLKTDDGIFYFSLGKQMYLHGYKSFDHVSIYTFLESKPNVKKHFEELGGYTSIDELRSLVSIDNVDAYYDKIVKMNFLMSLYDKGFNVLKNISKFKEMTSQQVYDWYDYMLNNIGIKSSQDMQIESLEIDDTFLEECDKGEAMGIIVFSYRQILN
ncbi:MAG: hypothetical protein IJA34_00195 [Lachnospiraceae bacterium]|nr:hypothetical protein [Lachnospiraceae bacterium]